MHSFISAATEEINKDLGQTCELKLIRVNSILSNSETKILLRLGEALKLR